MATFSQKFIENLKESNVFEAIETIKEEMSIKARQEIESISETVAKSFKLKTIKESNDEDNESDEDESMEGDSENEDDKKKDTEEE
jgi:hypothetical protein